VNYKSNEKMDIGDLGFLIIAFIVFIVNFIVKANKEKEQAQAEKQSPSKPELPEPWEVEETLPPLPPIFQNPFERENKADVVKKRTPQLVSNSQEAYNRKRESLQSLQEGTSSLSESLYKEDDMENIIYQDEGSSGTSYTDGLFHGNKTEEFKKAIIYSEILHRKYE
jgi:hypothetical protein